MRKELRPVVLSDFCEALTIVGYGKLRPEEDPCLEWRRGSFHLFLRRKGNRGLVLCLHKDIPRGPPFYHRAIGRGKELKSEIHIILEAYKRKRASSHR